MSGADGWEELLAVLREQAYIAIDASPEVLLSGPGGCGIGADATYARLYGLDDQIDADWRIAREVSELLMPISRPPVLWVMPESIPPLPDIAVARYVCWSGYAIKHVTAEVLPPNIGYDTMTHMATLLFLRYKRAL
jgi:hypothetical protein